MRRTADEAAATRAEVMDAALTVFAQRGYAATTLGEVAVRARVTRGAVYHHFRDKADLFGQAVGQRWAEVGDPILAELSGDRSPLRRLRRFVEAYLSALAAEPRFRVLVEVTLLRVEALPELDAGMAAKRRALADWLDRIAAVFAEAAAGGELRPDVDPRHAATAVMALLSGMTVLAVTAPEPGAPPRPPTRRSDPHPSADPPTGRETPADPPVDRATPVAPAWLARTLLEPFALDTAFLEMELRP